MLYRTEKPHFLIHFSLFTSLAKYSNKQKQFDLFSALLNNRLCGFVAYLVTLPKFTSLKKNYLLVMLSTIRVW